MPAAKQVEGIPRNPYGFQHVTGGVLVKPCQRVQRDTDTQSCLASDQGNPASATAGAREELSGR